MTKTTTTKRTNPAPKTATKKVVKDSKPKAVKTNPKAKKADPKPEKPAEKKVRVSKIDDVPDVINLIFKLRDAGEYFTHERQNRVIFTDKTRRAFMIKPGTTVTLWAADNYGEAFEALLPETSRAYDDARALNMRYRWKLTPDEFKAFVNLIA